MANKLFTSPLLVYKITPPVNYNQWLKRLDTQLNESTNQNSTKVVDPTKKKTLFQNFGD